MNDIYIGIGSNLGIRERNIELALNQLQDHPDIEIISLSKQYETKAISSYKQPDFLNCVVQISSFLSPEELLDLTESIETDLGRTSKGTGDPRTIDLDILFYNQDIVTTERLTIPHSLAHDRLFVLNPMNDLNPNFVHPILNASIQSLLEERCGY